MSVFRRAVRDWWAWMQGQGLTWGLVAAAIGPIALWIREDTLTLSSLVYAVLGIAAVAVVGFLISLGGASRKLVREEALATHVAQGYELVARLVSTQPDRPDHYAVEVQKWIGDGHVLVYKNAPAELGFFGADPVPPLGTPVASSIAEINAICQMHRLTTLKGYVSRLQQIRSRV